MAWIIFWHKESVLPRSLGKHLPLVYRKLVGRFG
jgi:hypothetical protein